MRREDLQVDGLSVDSFVTSRNPCRLRFDLLLHLRKVIELASWQVVKLGPFVLTGNTGGRVGDVDLIGFGFIIAFTGNVDKLKNERPSSDNSAASGKEVPPNYIL